MKAREKINEEKDKTEALTVQKITAERLYSELKFSQSDDIHSRLIEMSKDFEQRQLKVYKLEREHNDMVEKVKYYERLLNQRNDKIAELEKDAARSEAEKRKEREEFSKRDIERKEQIFQMSRRITDNKDPHQLRDA